MLTVRSTIEIASQASPQIIPVVQGDTGREILFTLADFTIPTGATATFYIQKPSGNAVYNTATIDGNTVLVELTAQSIIEIGDNYGQVRISKNSEVVTSFDFILLVKPFRGIEATESTTEMNIFDQAVAEALEQIDSSLDDIVAADYDNTSTYDKGEYCLYDGKLYVCNTAITTAESWNASHWTAVTVGEELSDLKQEISEMSGLSEDVKTALLQIASKVAYIDDDGQDYYDALHDALYPPAELVSISAVYTQTSTVYPTTSLDDLKTDLVVTATYDDSTTATVTSYTLSGSLAVGTSTVTVTYGGKTDTFDVTVTDPYTYYDYIKLASASGASLSAGSGILLDDVSMSATDTLETSIYYTGNFNNPQCIVGARNGQSGDKQFALFFNASAGKLGYWIGTVDSTQSITALVREQNNTIKVKPVGTSETYPNNNVIEVNGTEYSTGATKSSGTMFSYLGEFMYAISSSATSSTTTNQKNQGQQIGTIIIKNSSNVVTHELTPAYNGTYYGLYDKKTQKFYHKTTTYTCGNWT